MKERFKPIVVQPSESVLTRYWKWVDKSGGSETCWEWKAAKNAYGYGSFFFPKRCMLAHRFAFFIHNGELPTNRCICHRCDNPGCVNPNHLFACTKKENSQDMVQKRRHINQKRPEGRLRGEQNGFAKLKTEQVIEIRRRYACGDISQLKLAREFGIGQKTVWQIVHRESWAHIS